jgi:hypothetical protein
MHPARTLHAAGLAAAIIAIGGAAAPAHAAPRPYHFEAIAFDAPQGGKGGVMTPFVACSNLRVEPRVRSVIQNTATGQTWTYRWRGALPGYGFPRVEVGQYEVRTRATCGTTTRRWTDTVRVEEKTPERTVSRAEWRKIKRGMTVDRVAQIVGYRGVRGGRHAGTVTRTYDMMRFWRWSVIEYREGRVVYKRWNVDHD